ncbi:MAG: glycoside hydrolase family 1 protein [Elusimicrobia bacterium]|nr:glycoside hydrolase family 1 protein [Elusimicrobiota bacterium]
MSYFPPDFLWGVSTSAYQIEGNNVHSDLWAWEKKRKWEPSGACANSWELFDEDLACLKELGVNTYRFSVEWGRVFPEPDRIDHEVLGRYLRQAELLNKSGILPMVCLHHFTNPAWLLKLCPLGWADERAIEHFLRFADVAVEALGPQVKWWMIFNEPNVYVLQSLGTGHFPPGRRAIATPVTGLLSSAMKNVVIAHRKAYARIKSRRPDFQIGIAHNVNAIHPYRDKPSHRRAAERWDHFFHWSMLDAMVSGRFSSWDGVQEALPGEHRDTLDFVGINYYTRVYVRPFPLVMPPLNLIPLYSEMEFITGRFLGSLIGTRQGDRPREDMGHEVYPEGLREVAVKAWRRYSKPILITENGMATTSNEPLRSEYLSGHVRALDESVRQGVRALGYLHWSLLDNYEWSTYRMRFGLYSVDRADGFKRAPKPAAGVYRKIIEAHRLSQAGAARP